jgi:hypothetical protein
MQPVRDGALRRPGVARRARTGPATRARGRRRRQRRDGHCGQAAHAPDGPRTDEQAPTGDLAAPRYPRYYLAQRGRVHDAYARTASTRATHAKLHISQSAVRFQLALADELGAARLRRGSVGADTTLQDVKRHRRQPTERGEQCALEPTTR